jgi:DNA-binding SARP family transcriptional activator
MPLILFLGQNKWKGVMQLRDGVLKFYGLGSFYFAFKDNKVDGSNWVSKRALYLLMYLVLERKRKVSAEELIDIFWPESDLEDGKNKLYNTIYLLRRSLNKDGIPKDIVESVSGGYSICDDYQIWTDWEYFEEEVNKLLKGEELSIKKLKELFEIYRGDFYSNLKYEDWTELNRENLREYFLNLIEILTNKLYKKQNFRDTVNYLHKGIEYDPYRENFYLLYIKVLVKLGRIAEAINSYKKCEKILKEELDLLPGQELNNVYHRIKLSRELTEKVEEHLNGDLDIKPGAMFCDFNIFEKIYELELRQVKRIKHSFILLTIDFGEVVLEIPIVDFAEIISNHLRAGDVISICNQKLFLLIHDMNFNGSGTILKRFTDFCEEMKLDKKPSIDIKEIN